MPKYQPKEHIEMLEEAIKSLSIEPLNIHKALVNAHKVKEDIKRYVDISSIRKEVMKLQETEVVINQIWERRIKDDNCVDLLRNISRGITSLIINLENEDMTRMSMPVCKKPTEVCNER